ncbi:hypothetical protein MKX03_026426 [Papaver bracteatum]|nr:hypothetical protein MKX03_026426 [Papaver bracteatum]
MTNSVVKISAPTKFIWKIHNFSRLNTEEYHNSDSFTVGGCKWWVQIYLKSNNGKHLSVTLLPDTAEKKWSYAEYSLALVNQTNDKKTVRRDTQHLFRDNTTWGCASFLLLSELNDPAKGFIKDDTCIIQADISACRINVTNKKVALTNQTVVYPNAGKPFEEDQGVVFYDEKYEDVGGFSILKTQAPLYRRIWLKFGHIATTKVMPASSFNSLVTVVTDIMNTILDMFRCRFADVSVELIGLWDQKIKMGEKLEFNIRWLRDRYEVVRKDFCGVEKFKSAVKAEQQPNSQPAKKRVKKENGSTTPKAEPKDEPIDISDDSLPGYLFEGVL